MSCDCNTLVIGEAGPQGPQGFNGIDGTNGSNGVNAFSTLTATFTQPNVAPAAGNTVTISVSSTNWIAVGQSLFIEQAGYYAVTAVNSSTSLTVSLQVTAGISAGASVSSGRKVSPGGAITTNASNSFSSLVVNSALASNPAAFQVYGSSGFPLLLVNATLNKVGLNVTPISTSSTFTVGGSFESSGNIISSGVVQAPRFRLSSAGPELSKVLSYSTTLTVTLAGTVGAVTRVDATVTGAAIGDIAQIAYTSDPGGTFEIDVVATCMVTATNTVSVTFTNSSTNAYAAVSVPLKFIVSTYSAV